MENIRGTKSLKYILEGLKSNVVIFRWTIYLFNPLKNDQINQLVKLLE